MLTEALRWAAVAAFTAAVFRLPRPTVFWSLGPSQPLVLARIAMEAGRARQAARV